jgi:hypothetical protein
MLNVREYQRGNEKRNIDEEKPKKTKNKNLSWSNIVICMKRQLNIIWFGRE